MSHIVRYYILLWFCCYSYFTYSQSTITVYDSTGNNALLIENDVLSVLQKDTLTPVFTIKGNIIFSNQSQKREDILYLITGNDIFSKKGGQIISSANNKALYTFSKGKLFLGSSLYDKRMYDGYFETNANNQTAFFITTQNKPLFFIDTVDIQASFLLAMAVYFIQSQQIDVKHFAQLEAQQPVASGSGTIRRLWGNNSQEDFIWDGLILKKRWNINEFDQWKFDGTYISRAFFDTGEDWQWDGTTLQSRWNTNEQAYVWQGNSLKAVYGNTTDEFYIQGNIIKKAWTAVGNDEWEVNGEIPIPIIMMVVFRIVK